MNTVAVLPLCSPADVGCVQFWLCHYPEDDDLVLLVIKSITEGEVTTYEIRDVWFHELSCPDEWAAMRRFDHWRNSRDSQKITRMIERGELTLVASMDRFPHWEPNRD